MKFRKCTSFVVMTLFAALAMPVSMAAQDKPSQDHTHHKYKLIDLGTFGGPASRFEGVGSDAWGRSGLATGGSETSTPDPYNPVCLAPECFIQHTFQWRNGVVTDLGALPGLNNSGPNGINAGGVVTGISQDGVFDPNMGWSAFVAVVWKDGNIINLGTFGGLYSYANAINNRGIVAGFALNTVPGSFDLGDICQTF